MSKSLTPREREILAYVVRGMTNRQVGRTLYISEKTVKAHLANIFVKLGVSNRTRAAVSLSGRAAAAEHRLDSPENARA
jgi:two-component system response regulator DevR